MTNDSWNADLYEHRHSFVYQQAADLVELLAPRAGERILDVGCGTGQLTAKIAEVGAQATGIDQSAAMIEQARRNYPNIEFQVADVRGFQSDEPFDAVFSNAALHWVQPPELAARRMAAALRPGGRLVAELGGQGNVRQILLALQAAISRVVGEHAAAINPWYFPSVAQYAVLLETEGLEVSQAALFDRPTPLDDGEAGMVNWLSMFAQPCLAAVPNEKRTAVLAAATEWLRPRLFHDGRWVADYRRLRIVALRSSS